MSSTWLIAVFIAGWAIEFGYFLLVNRRVANDKEVGLLVRWGILLLFAIIMVVVSLVS
jgi:hypothetical protein